MSKVYFVTGTNRGLGLALVSSLAQDPKNTVLASVRDVSKATNLSSLVSQHSNIKLVTLDYASESSIAGLDAQLTNLAPEGIDYFIANAAYNTAFHEPLDATRDEMMEHFLINCVAPFEVFKATKKHMDKKDTKVGFFVSSNAAQMETPFPQVSSYGVSKAGLNKVVKCLAAGLAGEGYILSLVHPGIVDTDMMNATIPLLPIPPEILEQMKSAMLITPEKSALMILELVHGATAESSGKFFDNDGSILPW